MSYNCLKGDDYMQVKICSSCNKEKPISEFHKDNRGVLGVRADCKVCRSLKTKKPKEEHLPHLSSESFKCIDCGEEFKPTSNRQIRCISCKSTKHKERCKDYYKRTYIKKGYKHLVLRQANRYKDGIGIYQKLKKMSLDELECERCGSKSHLLVHHKNRDRHNNELINLELVCKSCHQKEHMIRDEHGQYIGSK